MGDPEDHSNVVPIGTQKLPGAMPLMLTAPPRLIERGGFPLFWMRERKIPESPRLAALAEMAIALGLTTRR